MKERCSAHFFFLAEGEVLEDNVDSHPESRRRGRSAKALNITLAPVGGGGRPRGGTWLGGAALVVSGVVDRLDDVSQIHVVEQNGTPLEDGSAVELAAHADVVHGELVKHPIAELRLLDHLIPNGRAHLAAVDSAAGLVEVLLGLRHVEWADVGGAVWLVRSGRSGLHLRFCCFR